MKKILLTTAAVLCFALPATARETETAAPVKQNAYLAFRLGGSRMNMKMDGEKENKSVFSLSGAIGTKIADGVRAELEVMTYGNYEETEIDGTDRYEYKHGVTNFSLNVLKDFDAGKIKPYVGGGLGFALFHDE
ncbi:MAG: outer membrane beta-barrel protein, partial [Alphaproteobacteria bacterium]|nr:outer membrane beta-barrel protein [Alphaproteobacteria bacterium]